MTVDELNNVISVPESSGSIDCTCQSWWGCAGFNGCDKETVSEKKKGCGIVGNANCKGLCSEDKLIIANPNS